jgi:hypothetical protein
MINMRYMIIMFYPLFVILSALQQNMRNMILG